jgi:AcrR family transcriptional regulator
VTLNDIAHHAGVGVGTVYRRFPDKTQLIEGLFEQRLQEIVGLLEAARDDPDPWRGLTGFLERLLELQAADRGLKELVLGAPGGRERAARIRAQLHPVATELVERARATGQLRVDFEPQDLGIVQLMLSAVMDAAHDVAPDLWRRYLAILIQGLKASPASPDPLPIPPVSPAEIDQVLMGAWKQRRA